MKRISERMQKFFKNKPKKIIVFGFPHSGTIIIKSIIGHVEIVEEIVEETDDILSYSCKNEYVMCKLSTLLLSLSPLT